MRRQRFIIAVVVFLAVAVVASFTLFFWLPGEEVTTEESVWLMPGGNPAHTSYLPYAPGGVMHELWNTRLEGRPTGPAAVSGGRVYVSCSNGLLYSLELETGRPAWRYDAEGEITSMPSVFEGGILVGTLDGRVLCVGLDGDLRWEKEVGGAVMSSPIPEGDQVYFGSSDNHLYCVSASNGSTAWSFDAEAPVEVSPCIYEGQVFTVSYEGDLFALDAADGRLVWTYRSQGVPVVYPAADEGRVYMAMEFMVYCADAQSGKRLWEFSVGPNVISNIALRGNQFIVLQGGGGSSTAFSLDTRTGDLLWNVPTGEAPAWTSTVATNEYVYFCIPDNLRAMAVESGTPALELELRGVLTWTMSLTQEFLLAGTEANKIHCYGERELTIISPGLFGAMGD